MQIKETLTAHVIAQSEFEKVVEETFGEPCHLYDDPDSYVNGCYIEYKVTGKVEQDDLDEWMDNPTEHLHHNRLAILDELCHRGLIEAGIYLMDMSW